MPVSLFSPLGTQNIWSEYVFNCSTLINVLSRDITVLDPTLAGQFRVSFGACGRPMHLYIVQAFTAL